MRSRRTRSAGAGAKSRFWQTRGAYDGAVPTQTALVMPKARLGDVNSTLFDFAITTFDVDVEKLASFLPQGLEVERFVMADGRERGLVSAVTFYNTNFYVHFAPFVRLSCAQTNYRAYVKRGNERVVWFFGTALASPFVYLPRYAWRLPWHRAQVTRSSAWKDDALEKLDWHARATGAEEKLRLRGTGRALHQLDGFANVEDTHFILTHPTRGFLRTRSGRIATYGVWHAPLVMEEAEVDEARFERFELLGLVAPGQVPHSVLVQRTTDFLVLLPPQRVREMER